MPATTIERIEDELQGLGAAHLGFGEKRSRCCPGLG